MNALRLGLLGTGIAAHELYWPELQKLTKRLRITAVCNRTREKAEHFAKLANAKSVCDDAGELFARKDVDAVVISLPIELQPDYVLAALKAGKHVLSEKPVAANLEQGRSFVKRASTLASRNRLIWLVGENMVFAPHVIKAKEWLMAERLGEVRMILASHMMLLAKTSPYFHTKWRQNPKFIGGFVVDGGVHLANIVRRLFGMPTEIKSITARFNPQLKPIDSAVAALRFRSGALGVWRSCFSVGEQEPRLRVLGSRADLDLYGNHIELFAHNGLVREYRARNTSFYSQFVHFHSAVTKGTKLAFTPEEALADLEFMSRIVGAK